MKRILYFGLTNIAVLAVLTVVMNLLGADRWLAEQGTNLTGLLIFAAIFGFAGSLISLFMSKTLAVRGMGARIIDQPGNNVERWLVQTVRRQAEQAGIGMPDVAVYQSPDINAFATGASRNNSLVAVSTGLLQSMSQDEVEAVLGHEVSHVANGDMVTMALMQGVLNTFVIFLARIIGTFVDRAVFRSESGHGPGFFIVTIVAQIVLGFLASLIVMWFSRHREFHADAGGARLAGRGKMISALQALQKRAGHNELPDEMAAFGISGHVGAGLRRLLMSHPPLEERIEALQRAG